MGDSSSRVGPRSQLSEFRWYPRGSLQDGGRDGDLYELPSYQSSQATLKHPDSDARNLTGHGKSATFH
jgi:hypothetical protein